MHSERGHTILLATILGIVAFSAWALAFLTTRDLVRTEKIVRHRDERDQSVTRALGHGIYLMRTGFPPSEPYECVVTLDREDRTYDCTVRFEQEPGTDTWTVIATRSTEEETGILPPAPERFIPIGSDSDNETGGGEGDGGGSGETGGGDDGSTKDDKDQAKEDRAKAKAAKAKARKDAKIARLRQQIEVLQAALEAKPEPKKGQKKRLERRLEKAKKALEKLLD